MTAGIEAIGTYLPAQLIPLRDLDEVIALTDAQRELFESTLAGMETVGIEPELSGVDMAVRAGNEALDKAGLAATDIDLVIYLQSRSPPYLMSSEATRFQHELGASRALAFSITDLGCANISAALLTAKTFVEGGGNVRRVMVAGASQPFGVRRYRDQVTMVGDGGCALIISESTSANPTHHPIVDIRLHTEGQYWDLYRVDYRGRPVTEWAEAVTNARYKFEVAVKTRNIFQDLNQTMLNDAGIAQPSAYLMQNLALRAFDYNEKALGVTFSPACRDNCRRYGHLGAVDIPLNIVTAIEKGEVATGDAVLVQNNSPAACWSSMLIRV